MVVHGIPIRTEKIVLNYRSNVTYYNIMKRYNFDAFKGNGKFKWASVVYAFVGWNVIAYFGYAILTKKKSEEWRELSTSKGNIATVTFLHEC